MLNPARAPLLLTLLFSAACSSSAGDAPSPPDDPAAGGQSGASGQTANGGGGTSTGGTGTTAGSGGVAGAKTGSGGTSGAAGASGKTGTSGGSAGGVATGGVGGAAGVSSAGGTSGKGGADVGGSGGGGGAAGSGPDGWVLTWSDEFDGPDGDPIDSSKWTAEIGGDGWGNQEREYYTDKTSNARLDQGHLVIEARSDDAAAYKCWYGTCKYTSARLVTKGKLEQKYGRFEARMQVPLGQGMWPAFWMLGNDFPTVDWPACGEIDIMENIGNEPATVHGSLHGPGYEDVGITGQSDLPSGQLGDGYHVYAVEWDASSFRFYLDDMLYETRTKADLPAKGQWVFDHPFFLLLNLAIGGDWPGDPNASTKLPAQLLVDYVRVYQKG